jgi:hypothetical protein
LGARVIGGLSRALDSLLGRGEAAVTVPPLDGAFRPNRVLDENTERLPLPGVDCLAVVSGELIASAGNALYRLAGGAWQLLGEMEGDIACLTAVGSGGVAVALARGDIILRGGPLDGRRYRLAAEGRCLTALTSAGDFLFAANGSATNSPGDWQLDLLHRNASGSVWRIDLTNGDATKLAGDLAYPAGLSLDGSGLVVAEAWKHRMVRIDPSASAEAVILYADLPGYPGRLSPGAGGGNWLAVFAPRSQLVEFVLREPAYRNRMVAEVPRPFWIAPKLRSGQSFYEPLQGGGVKHLGLLKPWAPTLSAGLCVKLDTTFQPAFSLHSRADGATHGVTSIAEHGGRLYAAARGESVVVSLNLAGLGEAP